MSKFAYLVAFIKAVWKIPARIRAWWRSVAKNVKKAVLTFLINAIGIIITDPLIVMLVCLILMYRYLHNLLSVAPQY